MTSGAIRSSVTSSQARAATASLTNTRSPESESFTPSTCSQLTTGRDGSTSTGHRPFVQSAGDTPRPLAKLSEWVRFVRPVPKFLTECLPRAMIRVRAYFSAPRVSGSAGGRTVMAVQFFGETGPIRVPHRSVGTSEPGEEVVADLRDHEPPSPGQQAVIGERLPKHRDTETDRVFLE